MGSRKTAREEEKTTSMGEGMGRGLGWGLFSFAFVPGFEISLFGTGGSRLVFFENRVFFWGEGESWLI